MEMREELIDSECISDDADVNVNVDVNLDG